jgi:transposase
MAADGRSTRSIAEEVGVQPRIVSNWRRRFADHCLAGLEDLPRGGKEPIYGQATNRRILALLDKPPPAGYARWTGPLLAKALEDVDVQYVWHFMRQHNIDLAARKSWCESNDPAHSRRKLPMWSVSILTRPPRRSFSVSFDVDALITLLAGPLPPHLVAAFRRVLPRTPWPGRRAGARLPFTGPWQPYSGDSSTRLPSVAHTGISGMRHDRAGSRARRLLPMPATVASCGTANVNEHAERALWSPWDAEPTSNDN